MSVEAPLFDRRSKGGVKVWTVYGIVWSSDILQERFGWKRARGSVGPSVSFPQAAQEADRDQHKYVFVSSRFESDSVPTLWIFETGVWIAPHVSNPK